MRLLCAGEAFDDLIFVGLDRLPRPGEEVRTRRLTATVGGGAVITAVAAARLRMPVGIVSALSDGAEARLRREGVAVTNLRRRGERPALTAALSTRSDRAFVTYTGIGAALESRLARSLPLRSVSHVHFAFVPRDCLRWSRLCGRLRRSGVTTSWDFGYDAALPGAAGFFRLIDALDFVFVNELEARLYTRTRTLASALGRWRRRQAIVIVKQGARGSRWVMPRRDLQAPATRVAVVDTTGAGDAFNAGFLCAWLRGRSPMQCLIEGNRVGSRSTMRAGGLDGLP